MTDFLIGGAVLSIGFGFLIVTFCYFNMEDNPIVGFFIGVIISCLLGFGLCYGLEKTVNEQRQVWNDGICAECGTSWHFQAVTGRSHKTYYYVCDNGHIFETEILFQK